MKYAEPLIPATLLRRYKRFLADMRMEDGSILTVHCANPGSMLSLAVAGRRCWLSHHAGTARKLEYSWELEEAPTRSGHKMRRLPIGAAAAPFS